MLFVSKKEPLNTESSLPDTSLHNVRTQRFNEPCSHSEHSSLSGSSSSFFSPSNACLSKLTKEQFELHREFLRLGSLLMGENIDLFHHALTLLYSKHDLKTITPGTSVCDVIPPSQITRHYNKSNEFVARRASNRKYVLPKDVAEKEFYQCMVCKERRAANSFGTTHTHDESARPNIRWYCPLCDSFFAVTHRGYHVKNRHSDILTITHSDTTVEQKSTSMVDPSSLKRPSSCSDRSSVEDECEFLSLSPPEKVPHSEGRSPSSESCFSENGSSYSSSITSGMFFSPCQQQEQDLSTFTDADELDNKDFFGVFPDQQQQQQQTEQEENFLLATTSLSSFSL